MNITMKEKIYSMLYLNTIQDLEKHLYENEQYVVLYRSMQF